MKHGAQSRNTLGAVLGSIIPIPVEYAACAGKLKLIRTPFAAFFISPFAF
jgi:hypothetical protein